MPVLMFESWFLNEFWIMDLSSALVGMPMSSLMFLDVVVVSDLNENIGGSTDLVKKRNGSADLHTPIHPLPPF